MSQQRRKPHFIQQWRKHRKLSLRRLAERMEKAPGEPLISHAQISRIEKGENQYTEETLWALAEALDCDVADLLGVDPTKDGEVIDLLRHIPESKRQDAIAILKALAG
jgi:transcriptional regulator with XRE-family HTH domain